MMQSGNQKKTLKNGSQEAGINVGDRFFKYLFGLEHSNEKAEDLVSQSESIYQGTLEDGINDGTLNYAELPKNMVGSSLIKHGTPNVERNEGDLLSKNLMQSRRERNSSWNDIPMSWSIEGNPPMMCTESAVSLRNCYNQVQEEKGVNYESMQMQNYNEVNTRVSSYNEEKDNILSRISNIFATEVNENVVESGILEECQRKETFNSDWDFVDSSSTFLSAKEVSNPYVKGQISGFLEADYFWNLIWMEKENIEKSRSIQELLRKKDSDELMIGQLKTQNSAKQKGKEKECEAESFGNNKSMGCRSHAVLYISSSSIENYHLENFSGEDEEGVLEVIAKPNYLQTSTFTEREKNRDIKDDECLILNSNFSHPDNIDIQPKLSLFYIDPSGLQDEGVTVISERGQVACKDYPHSRHHCGTFPFNKTSHDTCCPLCYCYVCDLVAPCSYWRGSSGHCHASDREPKWNDMRAYQRGLRKYT